MNNLIDWADLAALLHVARLNKTNYRKLRTDAFVAKYHNEIHWYAAGIRIGAHLEQERISELARQVRSDEVLRNWYGNSFMRGVDELELKILKWLE